MNKIYAGLIFVLLTAVSGAGYSQNQDAVAKAQYMLRQLNAEKMALQKENLELKKQLEEFKAEMGAKLDKSASGNKKLSARVEALQQNNIKLNEYLATTSQQLKDLQAKSNSQQTIISQYDEKLNLCADNNKKLYQTNLNLLKSYEKKGVWAAIRKAEPFTGLKKVEVQNLVQDSLYEIEALRVEHDSDEMSKHAASAFDG